ncbi:MAG: hypothetical protein ACHQ6T_00870 [Myxococcota bacterium]
MPDSAASALGHLLRAAEELALALAAGVQALRASALARSELHAALRAEERRWRARAASDRAAARVAEVFAALADLFAEPPPRARRDTSRKFDPPPARWDTRAPWRS